MKTKLFTLVVLSTILSISSCSVDHMNDTDTEVVSTDSTYTDSTEVDVVMDSVSVTDPL